MTQYIYNPSKLEIDLGISRVEWFTRDEVLKLIWRHTDRNFKGKSEGVKSIMHLDKDGGTKLFALETLPDWIIEDLLPSMVRAEKRRLDKIK
jgi:hypothetical protein